MRIFNVFVLFISATDRPRRKKAKVVFSYAADNIDELSLEPGQIIDVLNEEEEGWWRGILEGTEGVFLSNFVELLEEDEPAKQAVPHHSLESEECE